MSLNHAERIGLGPDKGKLPSLAWPGMYTLVYLCIDGEPLCADCATEAINGEYDWAPYDYDIHWEGPPIECSHCGFAMLSSYGE